MLKRSTSEVGSLASQHGFGVTNPTPNGYPHNISKELNEKFIPDANSVDFLRHIHKDKRGFS